MQSTSLAGKQGEEIAKNFLINLGYTHIASNVRTKFGEVDLLMQFGNALIAVEVKHRKSATLADPLEMILPKQLFRIQNALQFLQKRYTFQQLQIDCVAVFNGKVIQHLQNIEIT